MLEEPSSNAAVEGLRATFEMPNTLDEPPADFSGMAEDFVYEDHRSGVVNFGRLDASGWSPADEGDYRAVSTGGQVM